jgi:hypothetical protein
MVVAQFEVEEVVDGSVIVELTVIAGDTYPQFGHHFNR